MAYLPSFSDLLQSIWPDESLRPHSTRTGPSAKSECSRNSSATPSPAPGSKLDEVTPDVSPRHGALPRIAFNENVTRMMAVAEDAMQHLTLDSAYAQLWIRDPARRIYGTESAMKPTAAFPSPLGLSAKQSGKLMSDFHHTLMEKERRDRHRILQRDAHSLCCGLANELADQDTIYTEVRTSRKVKGAKNVPGKDNQLVTAIYNQGVTLLVARSEHTERKKAEARVVELEAQNADLKHRIAVVECRNRVSWDLWCETNCKYRSADDNKGHARKRKLDEYPRSDGTLLDSLEQRFTQHNHESSMSSRSQQSSRLPPSPSPSPSLPSTT